MKDRIFINSLRNTVLRYNIYSHLGHHRTIQKMIIKFVIKSNKIYREYSSYFWNMLKCLMWCVQFYFVGICSTAYVNIPYRVERGVNYAQTRSKNSKPISNQQFRKNVCYLILTITELDLKRLGSNPIQEKVKINIHIFSQE